MAETNFIGSAKARNSGGIYQTALHTGDFTLIADEPFALGGTAAGPAPFDYLCMALASCKAITIRMYAERKGWKVTQVDVAVHFASGAEEASGMNTFFCEVTLVGELTDAQRKRIMEIAKACPIERLLGKQNNVVTVMT